MSEIPTDVSPALLESPTAHSASTWRALSPRSRHVAEIWLRFWQKVSAHNLNMHSPTSARSLPWDAAPMQKPSQREVCFQQVRLGDGLCLKHKLQPTGDNQTAWDRKTSNSS